MAEKQDDVESLKDSMNGLMNTNRLLSSELDSLKRKHNRTKRRLWNHLYFTKFILGSIAIISVLVLVIAGGCYAFLKHDTEVGGVTFNDEITRVPFWGLAILGWFTIVILISCIWLCLLLWYMGADYEREE